MDTAKALALLAVRNGTMHDYKAPLRNDAPGLPVVAVPTTAGSGSEATQFTIITDSESDEKMLCIGRAFLPVAAIVDYELTMSMPARLTADTGIDALTHALEALVSVFASPFSDAFAVQSVRLIFQWLPKAYADGSDVAARTGMADAANIAGQAFANAFVGVSHALAHSVGARFHLAHGRANGIFLPHVLRYNAALPMKFMPGPGSSSYVAPDKYAELGRVLFGGHAPEDSRTRLFRAVDGLLNDLHLPRTLKEAGVGEDEYLAALPELALASFADSSMRTNPRMPLIEELTDLLRAGYYG
jgi:acetaldehyde dehydrogenase / alcohol dehydrogenase